MKNKKGKVATELLIMLITVVVTSAIIFLLVQAGVLTVKMEAEQTSVLNTEFIPMGREGSLAVKDFKFCGFVDSDYNCIAESEEFYLGSEIHFIFIIESSTSNGDITVVENYRIKGPEGNILLDVDERNNFNFDIISKEKQELITFKDFFVVGEELVEGEYTLELFIENPLLNKKTTLVKKFMMTNNNEIQEVELFEEEYLLE
jgi:hypothetical protein